jgi:hypothetical protein
MTLVDPMPVEPGSTTAWAGKLSAGIAAPQRQAATVRGTRRPHEGQTRLIPVKSRSGMSHNKGLNTR